MGKTCNRIVLAAPPSRGYPAPKAGIRAGITKTMKSALQWHQAGHLRLAEQLYQQVLQANPDHPLALYSLGLLARQMGQNHTAVALISKEIANNHEVPHFYDTLGTALAALGKLQEAVDAYQKAVSIKPRYAEAYSNMGTVLYSQGRYKAAVKKCKRAISLKPDDIKAYNTMALAMQAQGQYAEAIRNFRQVIRLKPNFAAAYSNLGNVLREQGHYEQAIANYKNAIKLDPNYAKAYNNLANILRERGACEEAIANYEQAIRLDAGFAEAYGNLGGVLREKGRFKEAIAACRRATQLKPDYVEAYGHLGISLYEQGCYDEAMENFERAIQLKPDCADSYSNLGGVLVKQNQLEEAISACRRAIRLKPDFAEAYNNLGIALFNKGLYAEAIENFDQAIEVKPDYVGAYMNRAFTFLLKGDFKRGWKDYCWRRKAESEKTVYPHRYQVPLWDGSPFAGSRLLVHYEQGAGDNIQCVRYLPLVKSHGGTVIFETPKSLSGLLREFDGIDELVEASCEGKPPSVEFDFYIPLMDLPRVFGTALETIPADVPYLYADTAKVRYWQKRLAEPGFKVGIVWAGSARHKNDYNRSCPLKHFAPLADIPGVQLYGLQKGPPAAQVEQVADKMSVVNLGEEFEDFTDTAAVIENMDLIISVDTSVLHLVGAMAKPAWALIPFVPDWRWLLDRRDNPWYPTARLFRQKRRGDWQGVLTRAAAELRALVALSNFTHLE